MLRAFCFLHRLVAYVILFCLSFHPFCDICLSSSRTIGEGRHCSRTIPGIDLFAEVTKTSLTSSRFSVWARLGSPQSMWHDIIIIFCWWHQRISNACLACLYLFLWQHNSWNHEPHNMCLHQRDWSSEVVLFTGELKLACVRMRSQLTSKLLRHHEHN